MSDTTDPRPAPPPPLSDDAFIALVSALANGTTDNTAGLSDADARAVWRVVRAIIARRREQGLAQPRPQRDRIPKMPRDTLTGILGIVAPRENPNAIVAEILAEPLLEAVLWVLAGLVGLVGRPSPSPPPGGFGI